MRDIMGRLAAEVGKYHVPPMWDDTVERWKTDLFRIPQQFEGYVEPRQFVATFS